MYRFRIIPVLLLANGRLVKTVQFKNPKYIGDPINAVRIFNEKEVDELILLDIESTKSGNGPNISLIAEIASEAFMPLAYGGGISSIKQVQDLLYNGVEKVIFNHAAFGNPTLIKEAVNNFGSSTVVVSIDVKKNWLGKYKVYINNGSKNTDIDPLTYSKKMEDLGVGEIFLNSIDKEGTYSGYDLELIKSISGQVKVPVICSGGASSLMDFKMAVSIGGASAVSAGSMFVYQGPHRAVLISYPSEETLINEVYTSLTYGK